MILKLGDSFFVAFFKGLLKVNIFILQEEIDMEFFITLLFLCPEVTAILVLFGLATVNMIAAPIMNWVSNLIPGLYLLLSLISIVIIVLFQINKRRNIVFSLMNAAPMIIIREIYLLLNMYFVYYVLSDGSKGILELIAAVFIMIPYSIIISIGMCGWFSFVSDVSEEKSDYGELKAYIGMILNSIILFVYQCYLFGIDSFNYLHNFPMSWL